MLNSMRFLKTPYLRSTKRQSHPSYRSYKSYQRKYTAFLVFGVFGMVLLFILATLFKTQQNYEIFQQLAFDTEPGMVDHLERELTQLNLFGIATLIAVFVFCVVLGMRLTKNILTPLMHMQRHMKKIIQGNWSAADSQLRGSDDLHELFDTYTYMYRSLLVQTEAEIKLLERLVVDPDDRESVNIQRSLIQQKRAQLGLPAAEVMEKPITAAASVVEIVPPRASRRAS